MVKNEAKIAQNTPKLIKTESTQLIGPGDCLEGSNCCEIVRTKLQESYSISFYHFKIHLGSEDGQK